MLINSKNFEKISIRGRVAFGICCLENAMEKYKVSGQGWNLLLENLWSFTSLPSIFVPIDSGGIEFVLERWFYNVAIRARFIIETEYSLAKTNPSYDMIDEKSYNLIRKDLIDQSNEVLIKINSFILEIGFCELWAGLDKTSPNTLKCLQKLIDFVNTKSIPLPDMEPFKQYEYNPKGIDDDSRGWGYTFDGRQYSKFIAP